MSDPLASRRVLLGVSGGIAAYKAVELARLLVTAGAKVDAVLTNGATRFVGQATFEGVTGRAVRHDVFDDIPADTHVASGRAADVAIVYPATAHTIARLANGFADDLLTTTLLAATCPLIIAPAMHTEMWQHPATRHNAEVLRARGARLVGPEDGPLMGGDVGPGRLVDPQKALAAVHAAMSPTSRDDLSGRVVVVTAGGTREPLDPVRFLGNRSSGRMGFAVAEAAARRGATVELVAAPTTLETPPGVHRTDVVTALEMRDAVVAVAADADIVVKAAAVADFRPVTTRTSKMKKDAGVPTIELVENPDILAQLGAERAARSVSSPILVGFAAETDDAEANGHKKLVDKGADLLVVNDVSAADAGFDHAENRVVILDREGGRSEVPLAPKIEIADHILDAAVTLAPFGRRLGGRSQRSHGAPA